MYSAKVRKICQKEAPEPLKFRGFMLNLKREIFAAAERTFRFAGLNASFENTRTFRFADYKGSGTVSHQEAIEKAEREFEIYREREMRLLESDFDKAVKRLKNLNENEDERPEEN